MIYFGADRLLHKHELQMTEETLYALCYSLHAIDTVYSSVCPVLDDC